MPYGGFCPDMQAVKTIADQHGIPIVEDACHAPLAELDGRKMGTWGVAGTFSFFSNKNLATGEGGMIVTDDEIAADRLRILRSHGITSPTHERHLNRSTTYDVAEAGYNYRLDEIRAAIGHIQLQKLAEMTEKRRQSAAKLRKAIHALNIEGLTIPFDNPRGSAVHHLFVILLPPGTSRENFRSHLAEHGVQTSMHYPLLHHFQATRALFPEKPDLPIAEEVAERLVTLPMGPHIDDQAVDIISQAIASCF
jgi:dTDP-4-amino-4,6-dideoxygalactose transaminase